MIRSLKELIFYGAEVARTNELQEICLDGDFLLALYIEGESYEILVQSEPVGLIMLS